MPTQKQRKAAENILENTRADKPKSIGEVLVDSGYSPKTAIATTQVTQSKGFLQVLEEAGVTDDRISQVLEEGLSAKKDDQPDFGIRHKYLETAIKVKGHITPVDAPSGNTYNTYIQQNNLNPNAPEAKDLVDSTLDMLMAKTKRVNATDDISGPK